jgi:hypothetical protein
VTQTLFQWNPMTHLKEFELSKASQLSIVAVNVVIQVFSIPLKPDLSITCL